MAKRVALLDDEDNVVKYLYPRTIGGQDIFDGDTDIPIGGNQNLQQVLNKGDIAMTDRVSTGNTNNNVWIGIANNVEGYLGDNENAYRIISVGGVGNAVGNESIILASGVGTANGSERNVLEIGNGTIILLSNGEGHIGFHLDDSGLYLDRGEGDQIIYPIRRGTVGHVLTQMPNGRIELQPSSGGGGSNVQVQTFTDFSLSSFRSPNFIAIDDIIFHLVYHWDGDGGIYPQIRRTFGSRQYSIDYNVRYVNDAIDDINKDINLRRSETKTILTGYTNLYSYFNREGLDLIPAPYGVNTCIITDITTGAVYEMTLTPSNYSLGRYSVFTMKVEKWPPSTVDPE